MMTKFKCIICGKLTAGRIPRGGDGTLRYPRRHKWNGRPCPGNYREAEWVKVDERGVAQRQSDGHNGRPR